MTLEEAAKVVAEFLARAVEAFPQGGQPAMEAFIQSLPVADQERVLESSRVIRAASRYRCN